MSGSRYGRHEPPAQRLLTALRDRSEFRFVVVGASCAGLYFLVLWALLSTPLGPVASGALAYGTAFAVAYPLQHGWTFGGGAHHVRALPRYALLQCACAIVSSALATLLPSFGLGNLASAAVATVGLSAFSFFVSRYWVFRHG